MHRCWVGGATAASDINPSMFLTPSFLPKTVEELKSKGADQAELAKQDAKLKQQVRARRTS